MRTSTHLSLREITKMGPDKRVQPVKIVKPVSEHHDAPPISSSQVSLFNKLSTKIITISILTVLIVAGVATGILLKAASSEEKTEKYSMLTLTFDTNGQIINVTSTTRLRCHIANVSKISTLSNILVLSWLESNGTEIAVTPTDPINSGYQCSVGTGFRRLSNSANIHRTLFTVPINPVKLKISISIEKNEMMTTVDKLYASNDFSFPLLSINLNENDNYIGPIPTPTSSVTPTSSITASPTASGRSTVSTSSTSTHTASASCTPTTSPSVTPSVSPRPSYLNRFSLRMLVQLVPPDSTYNRIQYAQFIVYQNEVYFTGPSTFDYGMELWKTNGTREGSFMVKDCVLGPADSQISLGVVVNNILLFSVDDIPHGREIWRTDGSPNGTYLLKDIFPGQRSSMAGWCSSINYNNRQYLLLSAYASDYDPIKSWITDGTEQGTLPIVKSTTPINLIEVYYYNSTIRYVRGSSGLFIFDSNKLSYSLIKQINIREFFPVPVGNFVYFTAYDLYTGYEMYVTDLTTEGTYMLKDINNIQNAGSAPTFLTNIGNKLFFIAFYYLLGNELYVTEGTTETTRLVLDIYSGVKSAFDSIFNTYKSYIVYRNRLYFTARSEAFGEELWTTSGNASNASDTYLVIDIAPGVESSNPSSLTEYKGVLYMVATHPSFGTEIWRTLGTAASTVLLRDIHVGKNSSIPLWPPLFFTEFAGILFFNADDGINGEELWATDGSSEGTSLVYDLNKGPGSGKVGRSLGPDQSLLISGNLMYFTGNDGVNGENLWVMEYAP